MQATIINDEVGLVDFQLGTSSLKNKDHEDFVVVQAADADRFEVLFGVVSNLNVLSVDDLFGLIRNHTIYLKIEENIVLKEPHFAL